MWMWRLLPVLAALVAIPIGQKAADQSPGEAGESHVRAFYTGDVLHDSLSQPEDTFGDILSLGYVAGVADALSRRNLICPSEQVKVREAQAVAKKYLEAHSQDLQYSAESLVEAALEDAFPCDKNKK